MSEHNSPTSNAQSANSDTSFFKESPVDRREFMRVSAATAGALTLPGNALANHESPKATELYDFIRNHVPNDYEIQSLIFLSDKTGFDELNALELESDGTEPVEFEKTTDPETVAYARLTPGQAADILEVDKVTQVKFSPGSNPFWKIGDYSDGVFLNPLNSADYIGFDEMVSGLNHLESEYGNRLNFYEMGKSVGYQNLLEGKVEQQDLWIAEVTNNINDEESFQEKEKPVFTLSIHGDERPGAEAGTRLIENILLGDEPEMDAVLNHVVLIFLYANPDGWVVRNPQYIGQENEFTRESGSGVDPNRMYPTNGQIAPDNYPAEPHGANLSNDQPGEIDDDVPERALEHSLCALHIVQHLRTYDNLSMLADVHGMGWEEETLVYTMSSNDNQYSHEELQKVNELETDIGEAMRNELGDIEDHHDVIRELVDLYFEIQRSEENNPDLQPVEELLPKSVHKYGSVVDTLGYITSGGHRSWAGGREDYSGLGIPAITAEIVDPLPNITASRLPEMLDIQVRAYQALIRAAGEYAAENIETDIKTGGRSTAYVTTDALTQSSNELVFADNSKEVQEGVASDDGVLTPNPREILGYEQREYSSTPFQYFETHREYLTDNETFDIITIQEVCAGALLDDNEPVYDNVVVIHDEGIENTSYTEMLDDFVNASGNLVLTDKGVHLLGSLENDLAADIDDTSITTEEFVFATINEDGKSLDHHLLTDVRPIQRELYNGPSIGYSDEEEVPVTRVDEDAFTDAGGDIGGIIGPMSGEDGEVGIGSLGKPGVESGIQIIGAVLPEPSQMNLHPFGLNDYSVEHLGHTVLMNALGYQQRRYVDGELAKTFGETVDDM